MTAIDVGFADKAPAPTSRADAAALDAVVAARRQVIALNLAIQDEARAALGNANLPLAGIAQIRRVVQRIPHNQFRHAFDRMSMGWVWSQSLVSFEGREQAML